MTEQQPYRVLARHPRFELRRYPAHLVAEVRVEGPFEKAGNEAFRPLARYIGGANRSRREIPMTAPVVQEEGDQPGCWLVRFVMPASFTAATLPEPEDPRITTREIPAQLAAAVRFSGRWSARALEERATALGRAVTAAGLQPTDAVRYARFDPPWKPWFLRRNEVVLPVVE
ncbi:heme-binding protein [Micromonospora globispora]|uniref:Heme-binding protein n=1 Tax=Micromonospora globispora TaxID=1450148 RepID=A0A317JRH8_9ACTN|nr:heme-binding protein [Micromonospora globispora]PWU43431.1 heme-binding protein [Micromonospora globispora]PWU57548.1 heme-binding protein [Micromonospora globispora]RQW84030.1 heme-binding protein [Micromonospora globispora]